MNSAIVKAANFMFDVKNIQESALPSKTGAVRLLAVSALIASVATCILLPAVAAPALLLAAACTGIIATTALKNRQIKQIKQINESDIVNKFKEDIEGYSKEEKHDLLVVCFSYLTKKIGSMPEKINKSKSSWRFWQTPTPINKYFSKEIEKHIEEASKDFVQKENESEILINVTEDQAKIEKLSAVSILNIIENLHEACSNSKKAGEIRGLINQITQDDIQT